MKANKGITIQTCKEVLPEALEEKQRQVDYWGQRAERAEAEIERLLAEIERLRSDRHAAAEGFAKLEADYARLGAACERMMIGGNHIALYKTEQWPDPGTDHMVAAEKIGAGQSYEMWCCWNAIMEARRALEQK